jgi:hypothetical protein
MITGSLPSVPQDSGDEGAVFVGGGSTCTDCMPSDAGPSDAELMTTGILVAPDSGFHGTVAFPGDGGDAGNEADASDAALHCGNGGPCGVVAMPGDGGDAEVVTSGLLVGLVVRPDGGGT